jgi:ATP-dependent Clp protease ATP-binding subunit ClpC
MPKVNVYLPNDLAVAVRAAGLPVSPVCQRALADAVRSAAKARSLVAALRDPDLDPDLFAETVRETEHALTERLVGILESTIAAARSHGPAGTGQLLMGMLDEGANLAVRILQALDVDVDELRGTVGSLEASELANGEAARASHQGGEPSLIGDLTMAAKGAVAAEVEAAVGLGHNYVGSEHLLLGLMDDPATVAARVLHQQGVQAAADVRRALLAALAGVTHGRQAGARVPADQIDDRARRLAAVEERLAAIG